MALSILTQLPNCCYSSGIPTISVSCSDQKVGLTVGHLLHESGGRYISVFSSTYYTLNGIAAIYNINSVIEDYMMLSEIAAADFRLHFYTDSGSDCYQDLTVVFSRLQVVNPSASQFVTSRFFTTLTPRLINPVMVVPLYFYIPFSEGMTPADITNLDVDYYIRARLLNGQIVNLEHHTRLRVAGWGLQHINISLADIQSIASGLADSCTVLSFDVVCEQRRLTFFVDPSQPDRIFFFKNAFNVWESAYVPGVTTQQTETKSSTAQLGQDTSQYDITHTRSFELQTAPLLISVARWLEQLLTSHDIRLAERYSDMINPSLLPRILITDYEYELTNAPSHAQSLKLTWQYASALLPAVGIQYASVFTPEYDENFA